MIRTISYHVIVVALILLSFFLMMQFGIVGLHRGAQAVVTRDIQGGAR